MALSAQLNEEEMEMARWRPQLRVFFFGATGEKRQVDHVATLPFLIFSAQKMLAGMVCLLVMIPGKPFDKAR